MTPDWLGAARRAADAMDAMLAEHPTIAERVVETGARGEGGDRTLEIDAAAERAVFAELDRLHDEGARFTVVSEERGDGRPRQPRPARRRGPDRRLDQRQARAARTTPLDRGRRRPDDGRRAVRVRARLRAGRGVGGLARRRRRRSTACALDPGLGERRTRDGKLELVGVESADPRWVRDVDRRRWWSVAHRLRAIGAIASTLCQVAAARLDGMTTLRRCRAVDAAAGQLIVREAGGHVAFTAYADPLGAPLDVEPRSPVVAARTPEALRELAGVAAV